MTSGTSDIYMMIQKVEGQANGIAGGVKTEGYIRCGTAQERFLHDTKTTGGTMILNEREDGKRMTPHTIKCRITFVNNIEER